MSTRSNDQGRAYEFAWLLSLLRAISSIRKTDITKNSSYCANMKAWSSLDKNLQTTLKKSADSAVDLIIGLEPCLVEKDNGILYLEFQKDDAGIKGDVRDIVIKRQNINWEIGLSIKHNHDAVKHSRLSYKLDFGLEWFEKPCSKDYWQNIKPIFDYLQESKRTKKKWKEIQDKESTVYLPLLNAFIDEIKRSYISDKSLARKLIEYLIGKYDYYKIISQDKENLTIIETFNVHRTLNKRSKLQVSAITVPVVDLPSELIDIRLKTGSKNTVEMYLNNGWQLSFRIHNASTYVEPSLKFDVKFIGMPSSILRFKCIWR